MGFFSAQKNGAGESAAIADFWTWWAMTGHTIDPTQPSATVEELGLRTTAIHPDLTWHFGPGARATHCLTLSAGGNAAARAASQRWVDRAPTNDPTWEFEPAHRADPTALHNRLQIDDVTVDLSEVAFDAVPDPESSRIDIFVYHPAFSQLPQEVSSQISFMVADWALGEDVVERWVGLLEPAVDQPSAPLDRAGLADAVAAIAQRQSSDTWAVLQGTTETDVAVFVGVRTDLRWIDRPTLDQHHLITVPYEANDEGLPTPADSDRLGGIEDDLLAIDAGSVVYLARETSQGIRRFHLYTDRAAAGDADAVQTWAARHGFDHTSELDPGWKAVREFMI